MFISSLHFMYLCTLHTFIQGRQHEKERERSKRQTTTTNRSQSCIETCLNPFFLLWNHCIDIIIAVTQGRKSVYVYKWQAIAFQPLENKFVFSLSLLTFRQAGILFYFQKTDYFYNFTIPFSSFRFIHFVGYKNEEFHFQAFLPDTFQ